MSISNHNCLFIWRLPLRCYSA